MKSAGSTTPVAPEGEIPGFGAAKEFGKGFLSFPERKEELQKSAYPTAKSIGILAGLASPIDEFAKAGRQVPKVFKGFKDLTTKILERLKGKSITSKQEILDFTNMPDVRQAERDLIRRTAEDFEDEIPIQEFANKVKTELLPLKSKGEIPRDLTARTDEGVMGMRGFRYENITLPDELRGKVANYSERIYESPIKTSAGGKHFSERDFPNYFAHSRLEDLTDKKTRRIVELQSDLFQKGALEQEAPTRIQEPEYIAQRGEEIEKLEPYRNTWHERIIREEVKQAAKDGKTKLQFPTGETAMKIEGLGETQKWSIDIPDTKYKGATERIELKPEALKVGSEVFEGTGSQSPKWIITDVLGDGKFKAVPKDQLKPIGEITSKLEKEMGLDRIGNNYYDPVFQEQFDISGKVDPNNPIYRFYEKEVGKFVQNKFGAKMITDSQGVKWWEVEVDKAKTKLPIEAFGIVPAASLIDENQE